MVTLNDSLDDNSLKYYGFVLAIVVFVELIFEFWGYIFCVLCLQQECNRVWIDCGIFVSMFASIVAASLIDNSQPGTVLMGVLYYCALVMVLFYMSQKALQ